MSAPGTTPGPWHVAGNHGYGDLAGHAIRDSQDGFVIAVTVTDVEPLEQQSGFNAHLIAASPALFEVVEAMASFDGRNNNTALKAMARAALAQARGETA